MYGTFTVSLCEYLINISEVSLATYTKKQNKWAETLQRRDSSFVLTEEWKNTHSFMQTFQLRFSSQDVYDAIFCKLLKHPKRRLSSSKMCSLYKQQLRSIFIFIDRQRPLVVYEYDGSKEGSRRSMKSDKVWLVCEVTNTGLSCRGSVFVSCVEAKVYIELFY